MRKRDQTEVFRITGARQGLDEDVRGRQRRYVISMLVRTVSVLLAAGLWNVQRPLAVVALVLGMLLPYVAVVIANAGRENATSVGPGGPPPTTPTALTSKDAPRTEVIVGHVEPGGGSGGEPVEHGAPPPGAPSNQRG